MTVFFENLQIYLTRFITQAFYADAVDCSELLLMFLVIMIIFMIRFIRSIIYG